MGLYKFSLDTPVQYALTGKFKAPYEHWMHDDMPLNDYELFVMTSGTLYISYNEEKYTVSEGHMLLLPPMPAPHNRRKGFHPSGCSFYWLHFSGGNSPEKISAAGDNLDYGIQFDKNENCIYIPETGKLPNPKKVIILMKQLQDSVRSVYQPLACNYMSSVILCEIYQQFFNKNSIHTQDRTSLSQIHHDIVDYIIDRISENLKVSEIAAVFGYNEKYISQLFNKISGITLKQFILKTKMDTANFLLTDTNKTVSEIAFMVGFHDSHNFMKAYKKIIGLTPTEYRNTFSKRLLYDK